MSEREIPMPLWLLEACMQTQPQRRSVPHDPRVLDALDKITPQEHDIINALYWEGISEHEYARRCGVSAPTIGRRHRSALKKLGELIVQESSQDGPVLEGTR